MTTLAVNKHARQDYSFVETFEAGIKLTGAEVKSVRGGGMRLRGAFVTLHQGRLQLTNAHIAPYKPAGPQADYDPTRPRFLLVKRDELKKISGLLNEKGLTMVPLRVYLKHNLIKLEFAIARGKKKYEKRQALRKKEAQKTIKRALRSKI